VYCQDGFPEFGNKLKRSKPLFNLRVNEYFIATVSSDTRFMTQTAPIMTVVVAIILLIAFYMFRKFQTLREVGRVLMLIKISVFFTHFNFIIKM